MRVTRFVSATDRADLAAPFLKVRGMGSPRDWDASFRDTAEVDFLLRIRASLRDMRREQLRSVELRATAARLIAAAAATSASLVSPSARGYRACVECDPAKAVAASTTAP